MTSATVLRRSAQLFVITVLVGAEYVLRRGNTLSKTVSGAGQQSETIVSGGTVDVAPNPAWIILQTTGSAEGFSGVFRGPPPIVTAPGKRRLLPRKCADFSIKPICGTIDAFVGNAFREK